MADQETLKQTVLSQVDYYFSDFNLHVDKYLRTLLESSSDAAITVDQLLTFKKIATYVNGDRVKLLQFLSESKDHLQFACFIGDGELICRQAEKPFVFEKRFFKQQQDCILYLGKLPKGTDIATIQQWTATFTDHCSIKAIKRNAKRSIRSALVVFQNDKPVKAILKSTPDGVAQFASSEPTKTTEKNKDPSTFTITAYGDYLRKKSKLIKTKARKCKLAKEFSSITISDTSQADSSLSKKKPIGMSALLAKRSLLFLNSGNGPNYIDLKSALTSFDVIYVYMIGSHEAYYLLFKNRTACSAFMTHLTESHSTEVSLKTGDVSRTVQLTVDRFKTFDALDLPENFKYYVKRVKAFFRNPHKAAKN